MIKKIAGSGHDRGSTTSYVENDIYLSWPSMHKPA